MSTLLLEIRNGQKGGCGPAPGSARRRLDAGAWLGASRSRQSGEALSQGRWAVRRHEEERCGGLPWGKSITERRSVAPGPPTHGGLGWEAHFARTALAGVRVDEREPGIASLDILHNPC